MKVNQVLIRQQESNVRNLKKLIRLTENKCRMRTSTISIWHDKGFETVERYRSNRYNNLCEAKAFSGKIQEPLMNILGENRENVL